MLGEEATLGDGLLYEAHEEEGAQRLLVGYQGALVVQRRSLEVEVFFEEVVAVLLNDALALNLLNHFEVVQLSRFFSPQLIELVAKQLSVHLQNRPHVCVGEVDLLPKLCYGLLVHRQRLMRHPITFVLSCPRCEVQSLVDHFLVEACECCCL